MIPSLTRIGVFSLFLSSIMNTPRPNSHQHAGLIDQELENRILYGLLLEWETVMGALPFKSGPMKKPVFSLKNSEKSLAHWNAQRREIAFSRSFVKAYPWDAVREVLVHEMAHQYAHEVLNASGETAHGPTFHRACRILGANPAASGSFRPLTDRIRDSENSEQDKTFVKIRKLLALGQSKNSFEAQAALSKARMLMEKFNVSDGAPRTGDAFISLFVGRPALRRFREDYLMANLLTDHYKVFGIWVSAYVMDKAKMGRVFEITGKPENVRTAAYVYDFIVNQTAMAWDDVTREKRLNRYRKSDFSCGLIQGFTASLDRDLQAEQSPQRTHARHLIIQNDQDPFLMAHVADKYPRIRRFKRQAGSVDENIRQKGRAIGESLVLARGIETGRDVKQLPPPRHKT